LCMSYCVVCAVRCHAHPALTLLTCTWAAVQCRQCPVCWCYGCARVHDHQCSSWLSHAGVAADGPVEGAQDTGNGGVRWRCDRAGSNHTSCRCVSRHQISIIPLSCAYLLPRP
jgi:hypothetical protein